jgi:hypothetical protein
MNTVMNGIAKYIDKEIYSGMNDWQELIARIAVGRVLNDRQVLIEKLTQNPLIKSLVLIDDNGMVDVDRLFDEIKKAMEGKDKIKISIPLFGTMSFSPADADKLYKEIIAM